MQSATTGAAISPHLPIRQDWLERRHEEIIEPKLPIVDPHHHLVDRLETGRYLLPELLADTGSGHNITATVYLEWLSMYRAAGRAEMRPVGEIEFANGVAAMAASGTYGKTRLCPFIIRWPSQITPGRVSNEIVHEVDTFTTFAAIAGASVPKDRPIDGVDQTDFFLGKSDKSNREGFPVFVADRLEAVKWRNWKIVLYDEQRDWWSPPAKLGTPKAFDLITDPKEEFPATGIRNTWAARPAMNMVVEFEKSLRKYSPIAPGTPDPYVPPNQ